MVKFLCEKKYCIILCLSFIKKFLVLAWSLGFLLSPIYQLCRDWHNRVSFNSYFGFNSKQLGIFIAVVSLIAAGISQLAPKIIKRFKNLDGAILFGLLIGLTYLISPWAGIVVGGISLLLRVAFQTVFNNLSLVTINNFTESKDRSTTISSFNMLKSIPYVLTAYFLGFLMDAITARNFAFVLGTLMIILIFFQALRIRGLNLKNK